MKVERASIFCIRYMPTLRAPVRGSLRDHRRQRDERRRVAGPAALDREQVEVDLVARQDDLLAGAARDGLRQRVGDRLQLLQAPHLLDEPLRRLHLEHVLELRADVVEPLDAEGEAHAPLRPELVDQQRVLRALRVLEEQRRPAGLDRAVDDLGDLEVRVDLGRDANELALALEQADPLAQVGGRGHRRQSKESAYSTASLSVICSPAAKPSRNSCERETPSRRNS